MVSIDYTLILVIINFVILLIVLKKLLYKPLSKFLTEREEQIKGDLDKASRKKKESEQILEEQKQLLREAKADAKDTREKAIKNSKLAAEEILKEAHQHKDNIVNDAQTVIENEVESAKKDLKDEIGQLVVNMAEKIIGKKLNDESDAELIKSVVQPGSEKLSEEK